MQVLEDLHDERFRGKRQNAQEADSCEERKSRGELVAVLEAHRVRQTCAKLKDTPAATKLENCRRLAWRSSLTKGAGPAQLGGFRIALGAGLSAIRNPPSRRCAIFKDTYCGEFLPTLAGA